MNDCMLAVFCLSEEGEKFRVILVNHQIHKSRLCKLDFKTSQTLPKSLWDFIVPELANRILDKIVSVGATNRESI